MNVIGEAVNGDWPRPILRPASRLSCAEGVDTSVELARAEAAVDIEFATPAPPLCSVLYENDEMVTVACLDFPLCVGMISLLRRFGL